MKLRKLRDRVLNGHGWAVLGNLTESLPHNSLVSRGCRWLLGCKTLLSLSTSDTEKTEKGMFDVWFAKRDIVSFDSELGTFLYPILTDKIKMPLIRSWYFYHDRPGKISGRVEQYTLNDGVSLYFTVDVNWANESHVYPTMYCASNVKEYVSAALCKKLQEYYGTEIHLRLKATSSGMELQLHGMKTVDLEYVGTNDAVDLAQKVQAYHDANLSRSFLFLGEPGTGKSTLARKLARELNGSFLQIPSEILTGQECSIFLLLNLLKLMNPKVVLFDDIHAVPSERLPGILEFLETINREMLVKTVVIATANSMKGVAGAVRRPGRFDEATIFPLPDIKEREQILLHYGKKYQIEQQVQEYMALLSEKTDGLTGAYLQELCKMIKALSIHPNFGALLKERIEDMNFIATADLDPTTLESAKNETGKIGFVPKNASVGPRIVPWNSAK